MTDGDSILRRAAAAPDDVTARIAAAYHCDAHRTEAEAIDHYDAAWALGVPAAERKEFLLGYGSTLKNVGRLVESERVLRQAVAEFPDDRALPAFLALTLQAADRSNAAVATLLETLLALGDAAPGVAAYGRALSHYAAELAAAPRPCRRALFVLYVADQARSAAFYARALNAEPTLDVPGMTEFRLTGGSRLGLMPERGIVALLGDALPDPAQAAGVPRAETYLLVDDPAACHQRALAAGATELSPLGLRDWGDEAAYSLDPDGHVLIFARQTGDH